MPTNAQQLSTNPASKVLALAIASNAAESKKMGKLKSSEASRNPPSPKTKKQTMVLNDGLMTAMVWKQVTQVVVKALILWERVVAVPSFRVQFVFPRRSGSRSGWHLFRVLSFCSHPVPRTWDLGSDVDQVAEPVQMRGKPTDQHWDFRNNDWISWYTSWGMMIWSSISM